MTSALVCSKGIKTNIDWTGILFPSTGLRSFERALGVSFHLLGVEDSPQVRPLELKAKIPSSLSNFHLPPRTLESAFSFFSKKKPYLQETGASVLLTA
ncbi:hypothetical protein VNO77_27085 [Canavalia gladiata]|uniref:Uncharacterized protein n=1 Tax=Canavalia gladiata TaxID=3824 RepID=A0AAN9KV45_CANGL